jgi:hypothetical protein
MNAPKTTSTTAKAAAPAATGTASRKAWVKKTPIAIVLGEISKQEERVIEMRQGLAREERELAKLQQARKVLEAQ